MAIVVETVYKLLGCVLDLRLTPIHTLLWETRWSVRKVRVQRLHVAKEKGENSMTNSCQTLTQRAYMYL
eukprot:COSAG01_NODE_10174_length_2230_cov_17.247771_2_plen_69_part_00